MSLFGCPHKRLTFPLSMLNGVKVPAYVCCLECGKEFSFDLRFFKVTSSDKQKKTDTREAVEASPETA